MRATHLILCGGAVLWLSAGIMIPEAHGDSLWNRADSPKSMFASKTAFAVGDLLTVTIEEMVDFNASQSINTGQKSSPVIDLAGVLVDSINWKELEGKEVKLSDLLKGQYSTSPSSITDTMNVLQAQIPVAVIDVLPNGNLVLEGMRVVSFSGEHRHAVFQGVVRPLDVDPITNTVSSTRVADARIEFISQGTVGDVQRKGWFTRFVDKVNPF